MTDRTALLESAFDSLPEGVALLDCRDKVIFWNHAAEEMTGYAASDVLCRRLPEGIEALVDAPRHAEAGSGSHHGEHGALVQTRHKLGHNVPAIARSLVLRDGFGERLGSAALFHPAERLDALPHGETENDADIIASQTDLEERLQSEFADFERGGQPLGVLWIAVDQGADLRRTHGAAACQAMIEKVQRALAAELRPAEELGRWGEDEFLVIAHERTAEMLVHHAQTLAGLARTADFRWWGDRVSLTMSIGVAQATPETPLPQLLEDAREAMRASMRDGGNRVSFARKQMEAHSGAELHTENMQCIVGGQR